MSGRFFKLCRRRPAVAGLLTALGALAVFLGGATTQLSRITSERDRAHTAEKETADLLASSRVDAGKLSMQRGQIEQAIVNFEKALELGYPDTDDVYLQLVEAHYIRRDLASARSAWEAVSCDNEQSAGQLALWEQEFGDEHKADLAKVVKDLPKGANRNYALALFAPSTTEAIEFCRIALAEDAFHFRARRMLVFALLTQASFDRAAIELRIARQLFPESEDFRLLDSLCNAGVGNIQICRSLINDTDLAENEKQAWSGLGDFIYNYRFKTSISTGNAGLNIVQVQSVVERFCAEYQSMIVERNWILSKPVAEKLQVFRTLLANLSANEKVDNAETLYELARVHPEATLSLLAGELQVETISDGYADDKSNHRNNQIDRIEKARASYAAALVAEGLGRDAELVAQKGVYICSVLLAMVHKHEVEQNERVMLNASKHIDTAAITSLDALRSFAISSLNVDDQDEAARWIERWVGQTSSDETQLIHALFHRAVLNQRRRQWLDVRRDSLAVIEIDSKFVNAAQILKKAEAEIRKVLDSNHHGDENSGENVGSGKIDNF